MHPQSLPVFSRRSDSGYLPFAAAHSIQSLDALVTAAHEAAAGHGSRSHFLPVRRSKKYRMLARGRAERAAPSSPAQSLPVTAEHGRREAVVPQKVSSRGLTP